MKKSLLTLIVIGAAVSFSVAQGLTGGVKAGLNFANVGGDDVEDTDMRIAYHVGGYVNFAFSESLSLQPELLYNSIGTKFEEQGDGDSYDVTYKLNYISVPVLLVYSFGNFNVQAGPQIGFLASAKAKYDIDGADDEDIKDYFKGTDFGFNLGLGANFGKINAALRYTAGLSNIADSDDGDVKNSNIQLSVGYRLFGGE